MAKPDNRSDNVEHLQQHINHTIENLEEAEEYLDEHADEISPEEKSSILEKNEHRRESLQAFREEIRDEATDGNA
ncbi:small acid-soluble spore protein Tlp [Paenibacillus hamazuiensis]|uniref:small acid-soluble spore protein Tlp n=1 Tax=Paenibacillus hamazuiensis TaxID=2936508 RepID=UPI00200DD17D|nr:small acid-soluble spore protein Tlp [Paenibacillus hamazuiensis]